MATFFWADTHFNHRALIKLCPKTRPYKDHHEMNEDLILRWNATVLSERDSVWILGDFGFTTADGDNLEEIFYRLRGKKHLIAGNHDERNPKVMKLPWERKERLYTFKEAGSRAELCHYPLETWKGGATNALMLHGHSHGSLRRVINHRFDVGVDVRPLPVLWDDIVAEAKAQSYQPQDHHSDL